MKLFSKFSKGLCFLQLVINFLKGGNKNLKKIFTDIYKNNGFRGSNSISGKGSDLIQTEIMRKEIPQVLRELKIKIFLDAPCGDFYWMKETNLDNIKEYIGIDCVEEIIQINNQKYKNTKRTFLCKDITKEKLPFAELVLCRDCLVHLSFLDAQKIIQNFKKAGIIYLLTTTFTERDKNKDLRARLWRPLNLERAPFYFPKPLKIINEECRELNGNFTDKSLGLWKLDDIYF